MTSKLHEFHLSLLGKDISPVQSARDLGVILDPYLTFENHITTSVSECIARLAQINRVKHCLDRNTLLTVVHTLVFSKIYYCWNVWANTTNKNVRKLQAVQNFACPIVSGAKKYDHVTPLLKSLSWLPLKDQLYYRLQAIMAFKCMTGHAPEYLTSQFTTREQFSERTTRSSQKLNIPLFRTDSGQRTFYYRTVKLWNNLESFLTLSLSVKILKRSLRSQILDNFVRCSYRCRTSDLLETFSIRFFMGNCKPQTTKCHLTKALRSRLQFAVHV